MAKYLSNLTNTRKLERLWNLTQIAQQVSETPDSFQRALLQYNVTEPVFNILETDWKTISIDGNTNASARTTLKNGPVGSDFGYSFDTLFETGSPISLPEEFLPFLNYQILTKCGPESQILPLNNWTTFEGALYQKLTVGGLQIFDGDPNLLSGVHRFQQSEIDDGIVNVNSCKKAWFVTRGANSGYLQQLIITYDTTPAASPCGVHNNFKQIIINYHEFEKHKINSLTTSSFSGIGTIIEHTWTFDGMTCTENTVTTVDKGPVSFSFSGADDITIALENTSGTQTFVGTVTGLDSVVDSGYWLYYGTNTYVPRVKLTTSSNDEILDILPKDSTNTFVNLGQIVLEPHFVDDTASSRLRPINGKDFMIVKLNEDKDKPFKKFNMLIGFEAVLMGKATVIESDLAANEKLNTYNFSGSAYVKSNSDMSPKYRYHLESQDVQVKLVITLKNPLYYRNILSYRNGSV